MLEFKVSEIRRAQPGTGCENPEGEYSYSSTLSLTLALHGGGVVNACLGHFTPGKKTRYPLYRRLGEPQGRSGRVLNISSQPGFDPWTVYKTFQERNLFFLFSNYRTKNIKLLLGKISWCRLCHHTHCQSQIRTANSLRRVKFLGKLNAFWRLKSFRANSRVQTTLTKSHT